MYKVILISGAVNSGKTTFLHKLISDYRENDLSVGGFTAEAVYEQGQKTGYDAQDLITGAREPIVRRDCAMDVQTRYHDSAQTNSLNPGRKPKIDIRAADGAQRVGPFKVFESGLAFCRRCVDAASQCDYICIDEVGPLEIAGGGHRALLDKSLSESTSNLIIVVREGVTEELQQIAKAKGREVEVYSNW